MFNKITGRPDTSAYEMRKARMGEVAEDMNEIKNKLLTESRTGAVEFLNEELEKLTSEYRPW